MREKPPFKASMSPSYLFPSKEAGHELYIPAMHEIFSSWVSSSPVCSACPALQRGSKRGRGLPHSIGSLPPGRPAGRPLSTGGPSVSAQGAYPVIHVGGIKGCSAGLLIMPLWTQPRPLKWAQGLHTSQAQPQPQPPPPRRHLAGWRGKCQGGSLAQADTRLTVPASREPGVLC